MPNERRKVQRFYLDGDVEVTIKFPPGAVRWQSTQHTVSIATGEADLPSSIDPSSLASAGASVSAGTTNGPDHDTAEIIEAKKRLGPRAMTARDAFASAGLDADISDELEFIGANGVV